MLERGREDGVLGGRKDKTSACVGKISGMRQGGLCYLCRIIRYPLERCFGKALALVFVKYPC
jgi:hypothetical protein